MKKFNAEKELRKLKFRRSKDKYIKIAIVVICIIFGFIGGIFFTKSKYEDNIILQPINSKVDSFTAKDYIIASYIDGEESMSIPSKEDGYSFDHVECDSDAVATWDNNSWGLLVTNATKRTKCSVYFNSPYRDGVIASVPELYDGLIPVTYDSSGNVIVADISKEWYNYEKHNWANAVLVDNTVKAYNSYNAGDIIPMENILQMYVWIPRYRYQLWNTNNESSSPQAISIVFENSSTVKSSGTKNGEWLTHPAFTFGTTELNGIWVGKFENSSGRTDFTNDTTNIQIKPNVYSMTNINVSTMFNAIRNVELQYSSRYGLTQSSIDTHMMKNMEWGAVAYLTNSVYGRYANTYTCIDSGCEVWINNVNTGYGGDTKLDTDTYQWGPTVTGCAAQSVSAGVKNHMTACESGRTWYEAGVNASTTGNIYGLYDMSGGAWEYVMGNMVNSSGNFYSSSAGFSVSPESKYYDTYAYSESTYADHARGKLGDATRETLANFGSTTGGWYSDYAILPAGGHSWFNRGDGYNYGAYAGVFDFNRHTGGAYSGASFRSVLTAE